jgi:urea carboxylase
VLDLELRLRIHALLLDLQALALPGVIDLTPGIRSLQVHYDSRRLTQADLLAALIAAEERLGGLDDFEIPSRVVHLPLSWKDPAIYQTIDKYMQAVRDDAPWCPDNIEFIRRVNGLESIDDVQRIVFDARYLVMGLGDVYLGAPVATPVDPRHRLVTTKYNPARTWTPPNVVGIGGAYMCIYGMEGPGGYQLFGRTIQVWNTWRQTEAFTDGKPWLLRFFDQIRFFPVSAEELVEWRRDFPLGRRQIRIEEETFRLSDYRKMLADNAESIEAFQATRQAAFDAERADWEAKGEFARVEALSSVADDGRRRRDHRRARRQRPGRGPARRQCLEGAGRARPAGRGRRGDRRDRGHEGRGDVNSPVAGVVTAVYAQPAQAIAAGAPIVAIAPDLEAAA